MELNKNRLLWIDDLRGLAALLVIFGHYRVFYEYGYNLNFLDVFPRGVQLFYLLSGFILYRLYVNKLNSIKDYKRFIIKRFFRISPLYYFITIISIFIFLSKMYHPFSNIISHLFILTLGVNPKFLNGIIGVEWSVFVEFCFYLLFPFVLYFYNKFKYLTLLLSIVISLGQTSLVYLLGFDNEYKTYFYNLPTAQICFFVLGMYLSEIDQLTNKRFLKRIVFISGSIGFLLTSYIFQSFTAQLYISFFFIMMMVLGYSSVYKSNVIAKGLNWCGQRSYSLYLIHYIPLKICEFLKIEKSISVFFLIIIFIFFLSDLTYKYIEKPGIELGAKLSAT